MCPPKKVLNDIHMPYMAKLGVKHGNKKDTCYIEIVGLCAHKLGTNLVSIVNTNLGGPSFKEREIIFTLISYDFCTSSPILKLEITICMICNC